MLLPLRMEAVEGRERLAMWEVERWLLRATCGPSGLQGRKDEMRGPEVQPRGKRWPCVFPVLGDIRTGHAPLAGGVFIAPVQSNQVQRQSSSLTDRN
jgi:hypothetical protein